MARKRPIDEFCEVWDEIFRCKDEYGCDLCCPLRAFTDCLKSGVEVNEAMRQSVQGYVRRGMDLATKVKIIEKKLGMPLEEIKQKLMAGKKEKQ